MKTSIVVLAVALTLALTYAQKSGASNQAQQPQQLPQQVEEPKQEPNQVQEPKGEETVAAEDPEMALDVESVMMPRNAIQSRRRLRCRVICKYRW